MVEAELAVLTWPILPRTRSTLAGDAYEMTEPNPNRTADPGKSPGYIGRPTSNLLTFQCASLFTIDTNRLLDKIPLQGDELVLLAGTIVQGIGNNTSDYDVYVIGQNRPAEELRKKRFRDILFEGRFSYILDFIDPDGPNFDVDFFTTEDVTHFGALFENACLAAHSHLRPPAAQLKGEAEDFINSLRTAVALSHPETLQCLRVRFPEQLFGWVKFREIANAFEQFEDVIGAWQSKDYQTCLHMLRDFVVLQATALGQLLGSPSFKRKWFVQILRHIARKDPEVGGRIHAWLSTPLNVGSERDTIADGIDVLENIFHVARLRLRELPLPICRPDYAKLLTSHAEVVGLHNISDRRAYGYFSRLFLNEGVRLLDMLDIWSTADFPQ